MIVEIPRGAAVTVSGLTTGDAFRGEVTWYQADYMGREGYVHAMLLSSTPPTAVPLPTAVPQLASATVLFFYADWCPYCNQQMPHMRQLAQEYSSANVRWIDTEDSGNDGLMTQYGVRGIPHTVMLSDGGQITGNYIGYHNMNALRSAVEGALN